MLLIIDITFPINNNVNVQIKLNFYVLIVNIRVIIVIKLLLDTTIKFSEIEG